MGFYIALSILLLVTGAGWGQSGWHYLTGGCLLAVKNVGNNIHIVGRQGLILHSTDRGNTWNIRESGLTIDLGDISFPDSLHGWAVGDYGYVLRTTDGGFNWQIQTQLVPAWSWKVCFVDTLHGWACGAIDTVYKTIDGGVTWTKHPMNRTNHGTDICFTDSLIGFVPIDNGNGMILKSTDGGLTWLQKYNDAGEYLDMLDSLRGWATGGKITKTTDGWETGTRQYMVNGGLRDISIGDSLTAWAVGVSNGNHAIIVSTSNGGSSWAIDSSETNEDYYYGVDGHLQLNSVTVVGSSGAILRSTNSGANWRVVSNADNRNGSLLCVGFSDDKSGWAGGTEAVIHTTNGGSLWIRQTDPILSTRMRGVAITDSNHIWGCDENGRIFCTTNGGTSWAIQYTDSTQSYFTSISFADTLHGICVGGGTSAPPPRSWRIIRSTSDGGRTWQGVGRTFDVPPLSSVSAVKGGLGWACSGANYILYTSDGGLTWTTQPANTDNLSHITFVDSLHGWASGYYGHLVWTTDGGNNWQLGNTGTTQDLNSCAFVDTLNGFAVNGIIIQTTDGGRNWFLDSCKVNSHTNAVFVLDSSHVWTVGDWGIVLGFGRAGQVGIETREQGEGETRRPETALGQSYPNPTKGIASFDYELGKAGKVRVKVYNVAGQAVRTLVEGLETAGRHVVTWDGRDSSGRKAGSGTYFYCLEAGDRKVVRKMVVIR